jgi:N-dimethylarginine dimethylaminohydrolase
MRGVVIVVAALSLAVAGPLTSFAAAAEEPTIVYTPESEATFKQQLDAKKIESVVINKRLRSMRITLKDGSHVLAKYPKKQSAAAIAELHTKGVSVTVLSSTQAKKEAGKSKATHHKIRYIVGGVVIVVIVVVIGVLLFNRSRRSD